MKDNYDYVENLTNTIIKQITNKRLEKFLNNFLDYASFYYKLQLCNTKYTGYGHTPADDEEINILIKEFLSEYADVFERYTEKTNT